MININQVQVKYYPIGPLGEYVEKENGDATYGPFCIRFISGHSNIVRDLGPAHIKVINDFCHGKCMLNLNDDGTPELTESGQKVLSINMLFSQL